MHPLAALLCWGAGLAIVLGAASWKSTPFSPASVPLAVRSPYLSAWLNQGNGTALNGAWSSFLTGGTLGWAGFARVDGTSYSWMGSAAVANANFTLAVQKSLEITPTQSIFVMAAGPIDLTITFLNPIEPADPVNQSFPFSYLAISAASNDGQDHSVQVYSDISGEWIFGDSTLQVNWTTTVGNLTSHSANLAFPIDFAATNQRVQYGTVHYSTLNTQGATYQSGQDILVRAQFINHGVLQNSQDTNFRAISDNWPVFALAHDLGKVNSATAPVVHSVGHVRDPVVQYIISGTRIQERSSAFWSRFSYIDQAIDVFLGDYENALLRANTFDSRVNQDASKISQDYASLVALSIRQTYGAMELTVPTSGSGDTDTSDLLMFINDVAVNTVDALFPIWPLFLYINPTNGKQALLPLLEYQATGQYPNAWAVHDVGAQYPNATGHNTGDDTQMPIEESSNMLIMTLSYTQRTNDTSLIENYYTLLDGWAQYLEQNSLTPGNQFSTDIFAGSLANQTNLAVKGIIGIKAMSEIAAITGDDETSSHYSSVASRYAQEWQQLGLSSDGTHLTLSYRNDSSWSLAYNLYADKLLGTNLFPEDLYDLQTKWYIQHANTYGVPLDTRHAYSKSDWQCWTAAIVTNNSVRDTLISSIRNYAADGKNSGPFGDLYDTVEGTLLEFVGRPVVGGHLALLALQSNSSIAPSPSSSNSSSSSEPMGGTATVTTSVTSTSPAASGTNSGTPRYIGVDVLMWAVGAALMAAIVA